MWVACLYVGPSRMCGWAGFYLGLAWGGSGAVCVGRSSVLLEAELAGRCARVTHSPVNTGTLHLWFTGLQAGCAVVSR